MVVLSIFRFISRSNILIVLLLLAYVFTTALINILAMPIAFHKLVVPDARIVQGYTVEELRYFYTKIGPRGCDVYIRVEDFDFAIYMPTYMLLLGSLMVRSTRVFQCSDTTWGMLPVLAVTLDLMETYIQRQGCIRQLEEYEIRGASAAMQSKWMLIFISLLFIGSAFFTWVYQLCATPRKVKQS